MPAKSFSFPFELIEGETGGAHNAGAAGLLDPTGRYRVRARKSSSQWMW
jgi:hypothetical protein